MKKKTYNQPQTEVFAFQTETCLLNMDVSVNGSYTGDPIGD